MRIRSFIIAYALVLAILLFADRRPGSARQDRYSHVVDLTDGQNGIASHSVASEFKTRIIAPAALIPGTWAAGQIPAERLVAPLVVMDIDINTAPLGTEQISLDDIATWEAQHGMIPQGAVVAIRRVTKPDSVSTEATSPVDGAKTQFPITREAVEFLLDGRSTIGFAIETPADFRSDRILAQQIALHGCYVLDGTAPLTALPATGTLIIVAPAKVASAKSKKNGAAPVRILAMEQ
jgi:kynurenine formamidase